MITPRTAWFCEDERMERSPGAVEIRSGPWDLSHIQGFLHSTVIPMRLATQGSAWPLVQSLWFTFDGSALWCCAQQGSIVARRLRSDRRCAFEIAADDPPYRGVRGRGVASLDPGPAPDLLSRLISRYHVDGESPLASWLLSRASDEVAIRIGALVVSSWDYSSRMKGP